MTALRDLAVVGAGPAGLAAAATAARLGLDTVLVDEQPAPGGQIYRGSEAASHAQRAILGADYAAGARLIAEFRRSGAEYRPGTQVWRVGPGGILNCSAGGTVRAQRLVLATGAVERPVAFPGWTLPGVMTAGAAQIMMKAGGLLPAGRVVLAGTGPLLLLVAVQLLDAGVDVAAVAETTRVATRVQAAFAARPQFATHPTLRQGLGLLARLRRHGVRQVHGVSALAAVGNERVSAVRIDRAGSSEVIATDLLLVHFGVTPDLQAVRSLGLPMRWDDDQVALSPVVDRWGCSADPAVFVAGDGAGIAGAVAATLRGRLCALAIAADLGKIEAAERDRQAGSIHAALERELRVRPLLDRWFRPARDLLSPADDVVVCRCESVTAGQVRQAARASGPDANAVKAVTRCGMGPCGGRQCGAALARLTADAHGLPPHACLPPRVRPPIRPVRLGMLADAF